MNYSDRFVIVGTSHISKKSVEEIKSSFFDFKPTSICVELDSSRLYSLLHPSKEKISLSLIKSLGLKGFLFMLIARFAQQKLGKIVNMKPGADMLFAVNLAKNNHLNLFLIDQQIQKTIRRLGKKITFKEKWFFFVDLFKGLFLKKSQPKVKINLSEVPADSLIETLISQLKDRYPTIYSVLIDERNHFMAKKIVRLLKKNPEDTFLVVVGAGHKKELLSLVDFYYNKIEVLN